jgi:hypothetical protein
MQQNYITKLSEPLNTHLEILEEIPVEIPVAIDQPSPLLKEPVRFRSTGGLLGSLFLELQWGDIHKQEEIIPGLARGEVGLLVSPTNHGKTTLLRNVAVAMATGRSLGPFGGFAAKGKRVLYLDFEDTLEAAVADFKAIVGDNFTPDELDQILLEVKPVFYEEGPVFDGTITLVNEEKLTLSRAHHRNEVLDTLRRGLECDRDYGLVIIDTLISAFELNDENDNTEIANTVMKPLAEFAARANVAVLVAAHPPKTVRGTAKAAEKVRGGSAFSDLARAIYQITFDEETGEYEFRAAKQKGARAEPCRMRLDGRRFLVTEKIEVSPTPYMRVRDLLKSGERTPSQIAKELGLPTRSVERLLATGVKNGGFGKPRRGYYAVKS